MRLRQRVSSREAFTLIELIVVITIIGILGTLVVVRVQGSVEHGRAVKRDHDLREIIRQAKIIQITNGAFPACLEDFVRPVDAIGKPIPGGFDELPVDPWGHPYQYKVQGDEPVACTLGRDNVEGGEGENADVCYPPPR